MSKIRPLGRGDVASLSKAAQTWVDEVTRTLLEAPIVADLSGDTSHTVEPDPADAPLLYDQAQAQEVVELLKAVRTKQNELLDLMGAVLAALAQPIGS